MQHSAQFWLVLTSKAAKMVSMQSCRTKIASRPYYARTWFSGTPATKFLVNLARPIHMDRTVRLSLLRVTVASSLSSSSSLSQKVNWKRARSFQSLRSSGHSAWSEPASFLDHVQLPIRDNVGKVHTLQLRFAIPVLQNPRLRRGV